MSTEQNAQDPTRRFSSRVADYVRYRPSYPAAMLEGVRAAGALHPGDLIADIGSGTGLLTRLFLEAGHRVIGVEPNADMRAAGEQELRGFAAFTSVAATAEATTLADASTDLVTAGQAFHWFDRAPAKGEFQRILKPGGHAALVWNERRTDSSEFLVAYEKLLLQFSTDYTKVDHRQMTPEIIAEFFAPFPVTVLRYPNRQIFDLAGVRGRLLSSSYAPPPGHPKHPPMLDELARIFERYQKDGRVVFEYVTEVHVGRLQ